LYNSRRITITSFTPSEARYIHVTICQVHLICRLAGLQCREGGLDLFHAAGRVVYNKRTPSRSASLILGFGDDPDDQVVSLTDLPPHLVDWSRRASKVDIDVSPLSAETD